VNEGRTFFLQNGEEVSARDLAQGIYVIFVKGEPKDFLDKIWKYLDTKIPAQQRANFEANFLNKMQLYSEAAALRVLITTSNNDKRYTPLLQEFEKFIFPAEVATKDLQKLQVIKTAMAAIQNQVDNPQMAFTWARNWLKGIGHDENNLETLMIFVQLFATSMKQLRYFLNENRPR
jgi:hypothetical protein